MIRRPPRSTLFPYAPPFRSVVLRQATRGGATDAPLLTTEGWAANAELLARLAGQAGQQLGIRSEEHTAELQSPCNLVCRLLLEKKKNQDHTPPLTHDGPTSA